MKTNAPKVITWWIATIVGVVGILSHFISMGPLSANGFWMVAGAFGLLALSNVMKDL